jgi:hypothetical protein
MADLLALLGRQGAVPVSEDIRRAKARLRREHRGLYQALQPLARVFCRTVLADPNWADREDEELERDVEKRKRETVQWYDQRIKALEERLAKIKAEKAVKLRALARISTPRRRPAPTLPLRTNPGARAAPP